MKRLLKVDDGGRRYGFDEPLAKAAEVSTTTAEW